MLPVHQRLIALAGGARRPRPVAGVPAERRRARAAARRPASASPRRSSPSLVAYAKLALKDDLLPTRAARRPVVPARPGRLLPAPVRERFAERAGRAPPAARDHHQRRRQLDGQPRRHHVRLPRDGGDRRDGRAGRAGVRRRAARCSASPAAWPRSRPSTTACRPRCRPMLYLEFRRLLDRAVRWFLTARPGRSTWAPRSTGSVRSCASSGRASATCSRATERPRLERARRRAGGGRGARGRSPAGGRPARRVLAPRHRRHRRDTGTTPTEVAALYYSLLRAVRHRRDAHPGHPAAA